MSSVCRTDDRECVFDTLSPFTLSLSGSLGVIKVHQCYSCNFRIYALAYTKLSHALAWRFVGVCFFVVVIQHTATHCRVHITKYACKCRACAGRLCTDAILFWDFIQPAYIHSRHPVSVCVHGGRGGSVPCTILYVGSSIYISIHSTCLKCVMCALHFALLLLIYFIYECLYREISRPSCGRLMMMMCVYREYGMKLRTQLGAAHLYEEGAFTLWALRHAHAMREREVDDLHAMTTTTTQRYTQ